MKKLILLNALVLMIGLLPSALVKAQTDPAFDVGDNTIGLAIGVGGGRHTSVYGYSGVRYVDVPAFVLTYDHGFFGEVGPVTIGIGGLIGYQYSYLRNYDDYDASWTNFVVGVRGTYHLTLLKDKNNKFDPYGGVLIGLRFETYKNTYYDYIETSYDNASVLPVPGVFVGAKYNFTPAFGAFAEVGYDIAILKVGINFNF
jgi:hypothetical protein